MLGPKRLLNLAASPLVVFDLVLDEGAGIALVVHKLRIAQIFDNALAVGFIHLPLAHLLGHLVLAVLCRRAKGSEPLQCHFVGHHLFVALIKRFFPNWSFRINTSTYPEASSMLHISE